MKIGPVMNRAFLETLKHSFRAALHKYCTLPVRRGKKNNIHSKRNSKDMTVITKPSTNKIQILEDIKIYLIKLLHAAKWGLYSLLLPYRMSAWIKV